MVKFDFGKLTDLAKEARNAAKEANNYAGDLNNKIKNKISGYSGKHTGNINTAYDRVRVKADRLRQKADKLNHYANRVDQFKDTVKTAEKRLTGRISSLMGSFKKRWNIKDPSIWEKAFEAFCDFIGLGDLHDAIRGFLKDLKAYFKHIMNEVSDWYHFKGGAELIDAIVAIVITIAVVILDIVLVIVTDGAWLVVIAAALAAAVAVYNAAGKISQYMQTFSSDHVLHMSANNKISSETDFASWLRRQGQYEAATAFQAIEFASEILSLVAGIVSFAQNLGNLMKSGAKGAFWKNFFPNLKKGGVEVFKASENTAEKITKVIKNYVKISNGIYQMIRTNNFGKSDGKAFWDTIKAGKDTWDTIINGALGKAFTVDIKNGQPGQDKVKFADIVNDYMKHGIAGYNKILAINNHLNLNLNNFQYDQNIDKPTDNKNKLWNTIGSPAKFMHFIAGQVPTNYMIGGIISNGLGVAGHTAKVGFQLKFGLLHPHLGIPLLAYEAL